MLFVLSFNAQEVFDWWSKYDASRFEEAITAEDKVLIINYLITESEVVTGKSQTEALPC